MPHMNLRLPGFLLVTLAGLLDAAGQTQPLPTTATAATAPPAKVPGVVIDHSPASSGLYIGSPSLVVWTNGDYLASHDFFGPKGDEFGRPATAIFRSTDRGESWKQVAKLQGVFWHNLFVHRGAVYLMGTDKHHGRIVIHRSTDGGATWTEPRDTATGLLTPRSEYHTAPVPVIEHDRRLWRAFEDAMGGTEWGKRYRAGMLSVPADADLLNATNWTFSNFLPRDAQWLGGNFNAWLEGNAVVAPSGRVVDVLRVDTPGLPERAAIVNLSADGKVASFDPATGFIEFPGGAKKFTIRQDPQGGGYWSLATIVPQAPALTAGDVFFPGVPGAIRNTLALVHSPDLRHWEIRCVLLHHPDAARHGFQYVDWQFDGDDVIAVVRTAYDDAQGGAHNHHDANYLTFHRWRDFRRLTPADSVPVSVPDRPAPRTVEARDFTVTGRGWALATLANDTAAFANRNYVWQGIPARFNGWRYTQTRGGERAEIVVKTKRAGTLYVATALAQGKVTLADWTPLPATGFHYTDGQQTPMTILTRSVDAGQTVVIPQGNWTGGLLLWSSDGGAAER